MEKIQIVGSNQLQQVAKVAVEDTSKTLSGLGVTIAKAAGTDGEKVVKAQGAVIVVEDNNIKFGSGTVTAAAGTDVGMPAGPLDVIKLQSEREVETYEFINEVNAVVANLQVQIEY